MPLILGLLCLVDANHAQAQDQKAHAEAVYESAGEYAVFKLIDKWAGTDASFWYVIFKVVNVIPGDSERPRLEVSDPPDLANLSFGEIQERLGKYIVAREEVRRMTSSPGKYKTLDVLDEEIDRMSTVVKARSK